MEGTEELIKRLETEINKTPTGDLRNLLCDANIVIQSLTPKEEDNTKKIAWWGYQTKRQMNILCKKHFIYTKKEILDLNETDIELMYNAEH